MSFADEITKYLPNLTKYARVLTRDIDTANDLVQSAVLQAIVHQRQFEVGSDFRAWLFTVMHNIHINGVRKSVRQTDIKNTLQYYANETLQADQEEKMKLRDVENALMKLPKEQREPILLYALNGWTYNKIADFSGQIVGTTRSRMARGREALREMVDR